MERLLMTICCITFAMSFFAAVKLGAFKKFLLGGVLWEGVFLLLGFLKLLPLFKIGVNAFTMAFPFFLGLPGIVSLLFFNVLSVI